MQFGRQQSETPEKPGRIVWDGSAKRVEQIVNWARDEALLSYAAATPPDRNAAPGTPEASWRLKVKVPVDPSLGGGDTWQDVPRGATVAMSGTWVEPTFGIVPARLPKGQSDNQ